MEAQRAYVGFYFQEANTQLTDEERLHRSGSGGVGDPSTRIKQAAELQV